MARKLIRADWGDPAEICTNAGRPLFRPVTITWSSLRTIARGDEIYFDEERYCEAGYLYIFVQNRANARYKDRIRYVGITNDLNKRFRNHATFDKLREERRTLSISIGSIDWNGARSLDGDRSALEGLEHLFIWTLWSEHLENSRKDQMLPGMGANGGRAWDIRNKGRSLSGQIPARMIYPWVLVENRADRSVK